MHQSVALERIDVRLAAGRQSVHRLEFGGRREVVGAIVESDEQNSLRVSEDESGAISSFGEASTVTLVSGALSVGSAIRRS